MKILVCISKAPDTTTAIAFSADGSTLTTPNIQYIMNPYDEWYALVKALEIKEQSGGHVTVVHVGLTDSDTIIRKALAIGADDAIRVNKEPADAMDTARQIAAVASSASYDLIMMGKETIDFNGSDVGAILSGLTGIAFVSHATAMQVAGTDILITRDTDGQSEVVTTRAPLIVSGAKGLAEQRIPNMRGIMMSKSKPLQVVEPVLSPVKVSWLTFELPPKKSACEMIDPEDMELLVNRLHEEAKVI